MDKIDSRTLPVEALNERRRRAVKMRLDGTSLKDTAAQCEMSRTTVIAAVKAFEAGGWKAVDVDRGGRPVGSGRTLSAEQEREVQRLIRDRTPDQLKMVYALWTRQAVAELIRDRYGIKLAVRTMGLYLERWGFTPQKPMKKAYEQSPAAVKKWLDEEYPVIAACAKVEGAEIHWGDETGLRSEDVRGRNYAPQGQTPVVRVNNKRHGLSVISTVTNKGQMRWKAFDGALNSDILIDFLRQVDQGRGQEDLPDPGQPAGAPQQTREGMAGRAQARDRGLLPAQLQPRTQPQRDRQCRPEAGRHEAGPGAHEAAAREGHRRHLEWIKSYSQHELVKKKQPNSIESCAVTLLQGY